MTNPRCEECDLGGTLLECDFCNLVWHNESKCLRGSPPAESEEEGALWACPTCWTSAMRRYESKAKAQSSPGKAKGRKKRARRR